MTPRTTNARSAPTWSRMNIALSTADGRQKELGFVSEIAPGLAVTPITAGAPGWSVTHLSSGYAIAFRDHPDVGRFRTPEGAQLAAIALTRLANWSVLSAEDIRANGALRERVRDILSAVAEGR